MSLPRYQRREKPSISIVEALEDKQLLGSALGDSRSWARWFSVLRAAFALPMSERDLALFKEVAGDREPPKNRVRDLWCTLGRRSGKSRIASAIAVFLSCFIPRKLASGEVGNVLVLAASQSQARIVFQYCLGFLQSSPILSREIESTTATEIRLRNGNCIAVHANSYRTVRGRTLLACIFDEVAMWRDETTATPDLETYRAVLPALSTTGGMLIGISSPYRKVGLLFQKHKEHFGQDSDDTLVVQGATRQFNGTLDQRIIDQAIASDPEAAVSEWAGDFRADISGYLDESTIERVVDYSRPLELPPREGIVFSAFIDSSGGRHDHYTIGIGHKEGTGSGVFYVIDVIRGTAPPFDPQSVTEAYCALLRDYQISHVVGDNYSAGWTQSAFEKQGIHYTRCEHNKSTLYIEALPLFMRQAIALPNHQRLLRELRLLERRTSRLGRDTVDHGTVGHDDYPNSLVGVLHCLVHQVDSLMNWISGPTGDDISGKQSYAATQLCAYLRSHGVNV